MKTEKIGIASLLLGTTLLSLGAIFTYLELWLGPSFCTSGPIFMLLSLSYVKYKVYAKYFIPILIIAGILITVLGWFFLPSLTTIKSLSLSLGTGIFAGGLGIFAAVFGNKLKQKNVYLSRQ